MKKKNFAHDSIQYLENIVHYLNMTILDILVEIIDSKLLSSLIWEVV